MITEAPLSIHEDMIPEDPDDSMIVELREALKAGREAAEAATAATATILTNRMATPAANNRTASNTNLKFFEKAARKYDAAHQRAKRVIEEIEKATFAPAAPKDPGTIALHSEIRQTIARLKFEDRAAAINLAIK